MRFYRAILYFPISLTLLFLPPNFYMSYCCEMLLGGLHIPKNSSQQWFMHNLGGKQSELWAIGKQGITEKHESEIQFRRIEKFPGNTSPVGEFSHI